MKATHLVLCAVLAFSCIYQVVSITNQEFFDLVKPYATDIEEVFGETDEEDDEDMGVIELPGGPNDELDIEYMLRVLQDDVHMSLTNEVPDEELSHDKSLGWWRHRRRRRRRRRRACSCSRDRCSCCISKTWKVNLVFKKIKFRLNACVVVAYLKRDHGFSITITYNGRRMYHKEISLKHPPALCYGIPGLRGYARICVQVYNVNLQRKTMCVRLVGVLDLKVKKFRVHMKIACFRIPIMEEGAMNQLVNDPEVRQIEALKPLANPMQQDESHDLTYELLDPTQDLSEICEVSDKPDDLEDDPYVESMSIDE